MTSDAEFIAQRRSVDDRAFLIRSTDPEVAPRIAPAVNGIRSLLADGRWHRHDAVVAAGLRASDLAVQTVDNVLRRAMKVGMVERRGEYVSAYRARKASDTREWRLSSWPAFDEGES